MSSRPYFGRCQRAEHRRFQVYRDDLVIGACVLGFFMEVYL